MNKRHYEHTLPNIRGSLSNTYNQIPPDEGNPPKAGIKTKVKLKIQNV